MMPFIFFLQVSKSIFQLLKCRAIHSQFVTICFCFSVTTFPPATYGRSLPESSPIDTVYDNQIRSIRLYPEFNETGFPIIQLLSGEKLQLSFDIMGDEFRNLSYTILLCTYDWKPSIINAFDYIEGYLEADMQDFQSSFSTRQHYVHYQLLFPNEDLNIQKSGNYLLIVKEPGENNKVLLTRRFIVTERLAEIEAKVKRSAFAEYIDTHQEVEWVIDYERIPAQSPMEEIMVNVLQNGRWNDAIIGIKPTHINDKTLIYKKESQYLFAGLKEYRHFDTRNSRYLHSTLQHVNSTFDSVWLFVDMIRTFENYSFRIDNNGIFIPGDADAGDNSNVEADYQHVIFQLKTGTLLTTGHVYITGGFNNWMLSDDGKMTYNLATHCYEKSIYLKQGYYEYSYTFKTREGTEMGTVEMDKLEGSSYETENDYLLLAYYRAFGDLHDRVIGYQMINSRKQ